MKKILGAAALACAAALPGMAHAAISQLTSLFVFGDSLSDGGNSGLLSQAATGGAFTFPPPPYAGGRVSNGPVAVEYLWNSFNPGDSSFRPSLAAGGTNYAIAGGTSGTENYNSINPNVPAGLRPAYDATGAAWQLQTFAGQGPSFDPAKSLFVVWFFANDVYYVPDSGGTLPGKVPGSPGGANLISNGIANIATTVATLANSGARHFLVPNLGDLGRTPEAIALGQTAAFSALSVDFNQNLAAQLTLLDQQLAFADIVQFDTAAAFDQLLNNPSKYGFDVTDKSCVANLLSGVCNPSTWVFWDGVHPTTATHAYLAEQFRAAVVPEPQTYALMFFGLLSLGWAVRRSSALR
jgi:phospholipase/lecithinase/hemolysin